MAFEFSVEDQGGARPSRQEQIWTAIRAMRVFCVADVQAATGAGGSTVRAYLARLVGAGIVVETDPAETDDTARRVRHFRLATDVGVAHPRFSADGARVLRHERCECMWRTMRILKRFGAAELARMSATSRGAPTRAEASRYAAALRRAGYLRLVEERPRRLGGAVYMFLESRFTGPLAPEMRAGGVYDRNLRAFVWRAGDHKRESVHAA